MTEPAIVLGPNQYGKAEVRVVKIALAADHAAYREKDALARRLREWGHEVHDFGTHGEASVDYPDHARPAAEVHPLQERVDVLLAVADALAAGNRAYEEKFGRVFLIRAAGRSAQQILDALTARLDHSPAEEEPVVAEQLREIAVLRLKGRFAT